MNEPSDAEDRVKKERSPSFPFISLKRAIERVQELVDSHKRSPARLQSVAVTWEYAAKSSGLLQTVAALKQYGLIDDLGSGEDRKIQVSDLAWRYLYDQRPGAKEAALQEAALKPKLIAEYNSRWSMERPSDAHCLSELQFERGFTPDAAKTFLKVLDETVSFANLRNPDNQETILREIGDNWDKSRTLNTVSSGGASNRIGDFVSAGRASVSSPTPSIAPSIPLNRATFPLPEGMVALEFPDNLSVDSLEDVRAWLEIVLRRATRGNKAAS